MGIFGKIKNIFYDEEIVEVPEEKKEERPKIEEVTIPKKEEVNVETVKPIYTERELFKTESTFKFPILDDEEEEPIKTRSRVNALELEKTRKETTRETRNESRVDNRFNNTYNGNTRKEVEKPKEEKTFKPSPIISPVYGILDNNYTKEELKERQKKYEEPKEHKTSEMNYDTVRRKAYGTLEEELESTISTIGNKHEELNKEIESVSDTLERNSKSIEDLLNEIEGNKSTTIGEIEELIKDKIEEEENITYKDSDITSKEDLEDKTLEHDLFNLIDSMYEEKEGD